MYTFHFIPFDACPISQRHPTWQDQHCRSKTVLISDTISSLFPSALINSFQMTHC